VITSWEPPGTLRAAWVITLVGAIIGTVAGCIGGLLLMSLDGQVQSSTAHGLIALAVGLFMVVIAVGWLNVWLATRARDGSNTHRWVLVGLCWFGVASDVVTLIVKPSSACSVLVNLAVSGTLLALLQFSSDTNDYFRRVRAELDGLYARPTTQPPAEPLKWPEPRDKPRDDPRPLPGTED
jgi:hypothetical protein